MTAPIIDATIATYFNSKSSVDTTRPLSNPVSVSSIDQIPAKQTPQTGRENGQAPEPGGRLQRPSRTSGPPVRLRRDLARQSVKPGACTVAVREKLIREITGSVLAAKPGPERL